MQHAKRNDKYRCPPPERPGEIPDRPAWNPRTGPSTEPSSPQTAKSANHSARLRLPLASLSVPAFASKASMDGEKRAPPMPVRQAPRIIGVILSPSASSRYPTTRITQPQSMMLRAPKRSDRAPPTINMPCCEKVLNPRIRPIIPPESSMSSRRKIARKGTTA